MFYLNTRIVNWQKKDRKNNLLRTYLLILIYETTYNAGVSEVMLTYTYTYTLYTIFDIRQNLLKHLKGLEWSFEFICAVI